MWKVMVVTRWIVVSQNVGEGLKKTVTIKYVTPVTPSPER
jgi:hypothetical protein